MANKLLTLKQFAAKRAVIGAIVAGVLNIMVVYFSLSGIPDVPLFAMEADVWKHSLIGALIPRAVVISLLITFTTVWATVKSRSAGNVHPPIERNVKWVGRTIKICIMRAISAFVLVAAIALLLRLLFPSWAALSNTLTTLLVGVFAAVIAFLMSYTAVLRSVKVFNEVDRTP